MKKIGSAQKKLYMNECKSQKLKPSRTPAEKELLKHCPPGMLDFLMMSPGKYAYGWIPTGVHHSTEDPTKMVLEGYDAPTVLENMGWKGFSSDQL